MEQRSAAVIKALLAAVGCREAGEEYECEDGGTHVEGCLEDGLGAVCWLLVLAEEAVCRWGSVFLQRARFSYMSSGLERLQRVEGTELTRCILHGVTCIDCLRWSGAHTSWN